MQASLYIIVRNGFSMSFSICGSKRMMIACAYGARDCPGYHPGQSAQSDGHDGGQYDIGENALLGLVGE